MSSKTSHALGVFLLAFCSLAFCGCPLGGSGTPPPAYVGGFKVYARYSITEGDVTFTGGLGGVTVTGEYVGDIQGAVAAGDASAWHVTTYTEPPFLGDQSVPMGRVNATWDSTVFWNGLCPIATTNEGKVDVTTLQEYIKWNILSGPAQWSRKPRSCHRSGRLRTLPRMRWSKSRTCPPPPECLK